MKSACPQCREAGEDTKGDNLVHFDDGHTHCFACGYQEQNGSATPRATKPDKPFVAITGKIVKLPHRKLTEETCRKFGYVCAKSDDGVIEVATYLKDGEPIGQKIRRPGKKFYSKGQMSSAPLWGQWLWSKGGRMLVITEGEIDAMSVSQVQDNKWPVVSIPSGATGAVDAIKREFEWVTSFAKVVICFDSDKAGQAAALAVAQILPPGKAYICSLPRKDANEMLVAGESEALRNCLWQAAPYRPDGILHISEVLTNDADNDVDIWEYPWPVMTDFLIGQRPGEIVLYTSATGSGKSTIMRELIMDHQAKGRAVGVIMLEESPEETKDDLISVYLNRPVRRIRALRALNKLREKHGKPACEIPMDYTAEEYKSAAEQLNNNKLYIYDHEGCRDFKNLAAKIEYMATGMGCQVIVLDHITAAVAEMMNGDDAGQNERLVIDGLMSELRSIVSRTGVHLDVICQLKKTDGTPFEEGGRITLSHLRGSGSLGSVPNLIIAMERNRQDPDKEIAATSVIRVLKNRFAGDRVGIASALRYDAAQARLIEIEVATNEDGDPVFGDPTSESNMAFEAPEDPLDESLLDDDSERTEQPAQV